jgi:hypothetical protein
LRIAQGEIIVRAFIALAVLALSATAASAQYGRSYGYGTGSNSNSHYVRPHIQRDGDFVGGHYRTNPNNSTLDNYSTRPNYNPYSGRTGRRGGSLFDDD